MICPCCNKELPDYKYYDSNIKKCRVLVMK